LACVCWRQSAISGPQEAQQRDQAARRRPRWRDVRKTAPAKPGWITGNSCATNGYPIACFAITKTSSINAVTHGTGSSASNGASCLSRCGNGCVGTKLREPVLHEQSERQRYATGPVRIAADLRNRMLIHTLLQNECLLRVRKLRRHHRFPLLPAREIRAENATSK
jgi:hypothetical protein